MQRETERRLNNEEFHVMYSTKYCSGDQLKGSEMGSACGMYEGKWRCAQGFGRVT
jgi:hypothetical protein